MHRSIIVGLISILYYAFAAYGLLMTDAGVVVTAFVLFMIPAAIMTYYSAAPRMVLLTVGLCGLGIAVLLEAMAHVYGLWYSLGIDGARLFGLVSVEMSILIVSQVVFLALLYETIFDGGDYTPHNARHRFAALLVFLGGVIGSMYVYSFVAYEFWLQYSYVWLLGAIALSAFASLGVYRVYSALFLDRLVHFTLLGAVPIILSSVVAVINTHKVFANEDQYLEIITIYGALLPLEELLLAFVLSFFVATVYEVYLDDCQ